MLILIWSTFMKVACHNVPSFSALYWYINNIPIQNLKYNFDLLSNIIIIIIYNFQIILLIYLAFLIYSFCSTYIQLCTKKERCKIAKMHSSISILYNAIQRRGLFLYFNFLNYFFSLFCISLFLFFCIFTLSSLLCS